MVTTVRPGKVALRYLAAISSGGDVVACGNPHTDDHDDALSPGRASKSSKHTAKTAVESLSSSATTTTSPDQRQQNHRRKYAPRRSGSGGEHELHQQQEESELDVSHDNLTTPGSLRARERLSGTPEVDDAAIFVHTCDEDEDVNINGNAQQQKSYSSPRRMTGWKRRKPSRFLLFQNEQQQSSPELDGFSSSIESSQRSLDQNTSFPRFDHAVEKGLDLLLDRSWVNCAAVNTSSSNNNTRSPSGASPWSRNRTYPSRKHDLKSAQQSYGMQRPQQHQQRTTIIEEEPMYNYNYGGSVASSTPTPNRRWSRPVAGNDLAAERQLNSDERTSWDHRDRSIYEGIDIARSDTTGASTEVATNRAVDIALRRIQAMEEHVKDVKDMLAQSITALAMQDEARSISVHEHVADPDSFDLAMRAKSILSVSSHEESTNPSGKLGRHVEKRSPNRHNNAKYGPLLSDTSTLSRSSVGINVDPYNNHAKRTLKTVIGSQRSRAAQPSVASVPEEHESDFGLEQPRTMHGTVNNYLGPVQKRTFRVVPNIQRAAQSSMDTIDSCRSPPIIQRRSYSQEEPSPDPVFCSKSLSAYSSSHISPDSVAGSFESEDAMFMETHLAGDDESSSLLSPESAPSHLSPQWQSSTSGHAAHAQLGTKPRLRLGSARGVENVANPERSEEQRNKQRNQSDENHTHDFELESINVHDRPSHYSSSNDDQVDRTSQLQNKKVYPPIPSQGLQPRGSRLTDHQSVNKKKLVSLIPMVTPPPPPALRSSSPANAILSPTQPPTTIVLSSNDTTFDSDHFRWIENGIGNAPPKDHSRSSGRVSTSNRMWEPTREGGSRLSAPLPLKLAKRQSENYITEDGDIDERSIDVQSIRSVFESLASPVQVDYDNDDSDDDTASVKSLRERFESSAVEIQPENGIDKIRCIFEKKRPQVSKKFESGNQELNEAFQKFEAKSKTRKRTMQKKFTVADANNLLDETVQSGQEVLISEQTKDQRTEADKPKCVADRIRALNNNVTSLPPDNAKNITRQQPWRSHSANNLQGFNSTSTCHVEIKQPAKEISSFSQKEASHGQGTHPAWMMHRERILSRSFSKKTSRSNEENANTKCDKVSESDLPTFREPDHLMENDCSQKGAGKIPNDVSPNIPEPSTAFTPTIEKPQQEMKGERRKIETSKSFLDDVQKRTATEIPETPKDLCNQSEIEKSKTLKGHIDDLRGYHEKAPKNLPAETEISIARRRSNQTNEITSEALLCGSAEQASQGLNYANTPSNMNQEEENDELMASFVMPNQIDRSPEQPLEPLPVSSSETMESVPSFKNAIDNSNDVANGFSTDNPVVIKPVARKLYVKPVPIKPVVPSVALNHFPRNLSATTGYAVRNSVPSDNEEPAVLGIRDRAVHEQQATLEHQRVKNAAGGSLVRNIVAPDATVLPRLVAGILGPLNNSHIASSNGENEHSDGEESEYSDGVTLDMSIAEVSNLTIPTALISRAGDRSHASDDGRRHAGPVSVDEDRSGARSIDLIEAEAKKSEASSSQTSEAAAPLIAKALRYLSDDKSTDTGSLFFRSRAQIASISSDWDAGLRPTRKLSSQQQLGVVSPDEEKKSAEDDLLIKDKDFGWDLEQLESLFPVKAKTTTSTANENIFDFDSEWQAFPSDTGHSGVNVVADPFFDVSPPLDDIYTHPSRSKTPTRRNTSRRDRMDSSGPTLHNNSNNKMSESFENAAAMIVGPPKPHRVTTTSFPMSNFLRDDNLPDPLPMVSSTASSNEKNLNTSHNYSNNHVSSKNVREIVSSSSTVPSLSNNNITSTTTTPYGPKHAALLARLRSLKEHRLQRAAILEYNHHSSFSPWNEQDEAGSCSTKSSTGFGGSTFQASLVLD